MSGYFQPWYTVFIVSISFVCLVKDYVQSDLLFCAALALLITGKVITVEEGIQGFANEGLLTVAALFVVAQGISSTGGLDWYMGRFLGKPKTIASAQIRLMFPIAVISAFLNNTPVVAVMIPIVQRWAENNGMSKKQVLMPLSFASILGGTCTLIGTSTNLVVAGMLETWAKENKEEVGTENVDIGLFDLGKYGVPVAFSGIVYVLIFSRYLLPGGNLQRGRRSGSSSQANRAAGDDDHEDVIVGAKVTPWSDAVGRTIEASGLRGLPGLYLVSVRRSGSLIRAVGPEFVINQGDILYFTGLIESLGSICSDHGLTAMTHEDDDHEEPSLSEVSNEGENVVPISRASSSEAMKEILDLQALARSQAIDGRDKAAHLYKDGRDTSDTIGAADASVSAAEMNAALGPALVSVEKDPDASEDDHARMVLGISAADRPGLLHDISKSLNRLKVQCLHSEASAVGGRSVSIWRIVALDPETKREEIRAVVQAMLAPTTGSGAQKERGQMVMRCKVKVGSTLVDKFVKDVDFRATYGGAIIAVQRNGRAPSGKLRDVRLEANDSLVVQVRPDSSLVTLQQIARNAALKSKQESDGRRGSGSNSRRSSQDNLLNSSRRNRSSSDLPTTTTAVLDLERGNHEDAEYNEALRNELTAVANMEMNVEDLTGLDRCKVDFDIPWEDVAQLGDDAKEFLIGVQIEDTARQFIGKSAIESGLRTLPKLFLVSIERGVFDENNVLKEELTIDVTEELAPGDILWYAGAAVAVSSLRKIPGLTTLGSDQASKLSSSNQERRLVQAVVAKNGPLVGKSIRDMKFRTRYNAVVLAVHREGQRVHAKMGEVVLHAGDVLLLDAGPDLVREGFALVSILEDSAPPRLSLLVPAITCAVAMIALYTFGVMSLLVAAILAAGVMIASGALSQQEARDAIKWDVIVTIAAAFGLSKALQNSGVASFMAEQLVKLGTATNTGEIGLFVGVYLATFLISNVVTNNAAAALMFPIAAEAAAEANISLLKMSYLLMLGASASFMSPFGYQTNLMVYGPGGYVFKDFLNFGFPMQLVQLVVSVAVIAADELWYLLWIVLGGVLLVVSLAKIYGFENISNGMVKIWKKNN
jgi:di/tricarboxylate transporter